MYCKVPLQTVFPSPHGFCKMILQTILLSIHGYLAGTGLQLVYLYTGVCLRMHFIFGLKSCIAEASGQFLVN